MAVTSKNIAYVRYDNTGRIVPGGPIVTSVKPKVGNWVAVSDVLTTTPNYKLRGFIRYIKNGDYVAGSLILQHDAPQDGNWKEVYVLNPACCAVPTTTTTTTTTPPTTTTTTTIFSDCKSYSLTNTTEGVVAFSYTDCCTGVVENVAILPEQTIDHIHNSVIINISGLTVTNLIDPYICPATTTTTTTNTPPPTTTTTTTLPPPTTTTTTTLAAVNFDFTLTCDGTINRMTANNPTGGSGTYQFTTVLYGTEQGALNSGSWSSPTTVQLYGGFNDDTYWVACRDANNPSNIIAKSVIANCQSGNTTTTTTTTITPTTTTTTTVGPVQYDLGFVCDPNGGSTNPKATNITGGTQPLYFTRFTYLTEEEALDPNNEYFGPYQGLYAVQWGTGYIPPNNPLVWVVIKDSLNIKTAKSVQLNCPVATTTTTQYVPFTTTTSTTPNPSNPYKSYRVNKYVCDQDCTPTSYNETITVAQAGVVEIGKYYITSNPNISVLILEQVAWNGTPGNDITNFTAHDFCYEACGYTPTTTTTTTVASAPTNTVFAKYDVVPGPAQDVNTVFVKYDVQ